MAKKKEQAKATDAPRAIQNRRARFDYELLDTYEAGLVLAGSEVKSIFLGRANLSDSHCHLVNGEMFVFNMDIEPYAQASHFQHDRRRDRKLLLHKREINTIARKSQEKGFTIIPTRVYFRNGKAKIEIALARGKRSFDKRESIAKEETRRDLERMQGRRN